MGLLDTGRGVDGPAAIRVGWVLRATCPSGPGSVWRSWSGVTGRGVDGPAAILREPVASPERAQGPFHYNKYAALIPPRVLLYGLLAERCYYFLSTRGYTHIAVHNMYV